MNECGQPLIYHVVICDSDGSAETDRMAGLPQAVAQDNGPTMPGHATMPITGGFYRLHAVSHIAFFPFFFSFLRITPTRIPRLSSQRREA